MKILSKIALSIYFFIFTFSGSAAQAQAVPIEDISYFAVGQNDSRLFVLNGDNSVSIFDTAKGVFLATRKKVADTLPTGIFASPSGNYFVTISSHQKENYANVSVYKTEDFLREDVPPAKLIYSLESWGIFNAVFSPDEKKFIIASSFGKAVWFLDMDVYQSEKLPLNSSPIRLVVNNKGDKIFVLGQSLPALPSSFMIIDVGAKKILATKELDVAPFALTYDDLSDTLFVSNASSSGNGSNVMAFKVATGQTTLIPVGTAKPGNLALNKKTGEVFVASDTDGTVSVIGRDLKVNQTFSLGGAAIQQAHPAELLFLDKANKLVVLNTTTSTYSLYDSQTKKISKEGKLPFVGWGAVSSKGSSLFFGGKKEQSLLQINAEMGKENYIPEGAQKEVEAFLAKPISPAIDEARERLYVGNIISGNVAVVNTKSLEPIISKFVIKNPSTLALNTETQKLYVGSPSENKVAIVDVSERDIKILATVDVGKTPQSISVDSRRNKIYIGNFGDKTVTVIDGATNKVEKTLSLFKDLKVIAVTPVWLGRYLLIRDIGGDSVAVFDTETQTIKKKIQVGSRPINAVYIQDQSQIFLGLEGEKAIAVLNMKSWEVENRIEIGAVPYRLFYDRGYVYVAHRQDDSVTVIKVESGKKAQNIGDKKIKFFGELDTKYNQFAYLRSTDNGVITSQANGNLYIVKNQPEPETGIMNLVWLATINPDGSVTKNQNFPEEKTESKTMESFWKNNKIFITVGAVILILVLIGVVIYLIIRRRREVVPLA
jgi:DNA-binding beta-propeller fold protein YncE